jgi:hypothetical protein
MYSTPRATKLVVEWLAVFQAACNGCNNSPRMFYGGFCLPEVFLQTCLSGSHKPEGVFLQICLNLPAGEGVCSTALQVKSM